MASWRTDSWIQRPFLTWWNTGDVQGSMQSGSRRSFYCSASWCMRETLICRWPWTVCIGWRWFPREALMPDLVSTAKYSAHPQLQSYPTQIGALPHCRARSQSLTFCLLVRMPLLQAGSKLLLVHFCNNLHISILCYTALLRRPVSSS